MSYYSDPTAGVAVGAMDREINAMNKQVKRLLEFRRQGRLTQAQIAAARKRYVGIVRHLFDEALREQA